jgi:transcriptional regulator with XRE-family HTH domain
MITRQSTQAGSAHAHGATKLYRIRKTETQATAPAVAEVQPQARPQEGGTRQMLLLRNELGHVLRSIRLRQRRTLRDVSAAAKVSLGYLSEVERGQKEASSELLGSICEALGMPVWAALHEVSDRMAAAEGVVIPDTIPVDFEVPQARKEFAGV